MIGDLDPLIARMRGALVLFQAATVLGIALSAWGVVAATPLGLLGWLPCIPALLRLVRARRRLEAWTRRARARVDHA